MSDAVSEAPDYPAMAADLEALWHREIPISAAMGMRAIEFDGQVLVSSAALEPNINIHGTAFAGSLYSAQALTGWGAVHLQLQLRGLTGSIVIASGNISYSRPVAEDIVSRVDFGAQTAAWERLQETGKTRFELTSQVASKGEAAAEFNGNYAVMLTDGKH